MDKKTRLSGRSGPRQLSRTPQAIGKAAELLRPRLRLLDVVDDAEDAVMFVEVDADIKRPAWLVCSLAHRLPFYTINYMRFGSSK